MMDLRTFFNAIRRPLFKGKLSVSQVEGMCKIIDYREVKWPGMIDEEFAYVLATTYHETAFSMQPVEEGYPMKGERLRKFQRGLRYYPWFGRGLVQITWRRNYVKFGITDANQALQWPTALRCLFEGMIYGKYTGKKLADYINAEQQDYIRARQIINGMDRAREIADYAETFLAAIQEARVPQPFSPKDIGVTQEKKPMNGKFISSILNMVVGNPLTGIPGAIGICALAGPVLHAAGDVLIEIGQGGSPWTAIGKFITDPAVSQFGLSIGLFSAKDWNVTGGTKEQ